MYKAYGQLLLGRATPDVVTVGQIKKQLVCHCRGHGQMMYLSFDLDRLECVLSSVKQ